MDIRHRIELLPSPRAKMMNQAGGRYFVDDRGVRLPSVTTILNVTKPQADRDSLARWRERVGVEEAGRIATHASRRGTHTHRQIQSYLLGEAKDCPETAKPYWDSVHPLLTDIDDVRLVEGTVFHYDLGYAGKVDCVASYQGTPCILDWKTSDRPKGSVERLYDGPLQLAAYCGAVNHFYSEHGIKISHALLGVAIAGEPAEVFWFDADALKEYWHRWQDRVQQYYRRRGRSPGYTHSSNSDDL